MDEIGSFISSNDQLSRGKKKQSGRSAKKRCKCTNCLYVQPNPRQKNANPSQKKNWRLKVKSLPNPSTSKSLTDFYTKKHMFGGQVYCLRFPHQSFKLQFSGSGGSNKWLQTLSNDRPISNKSTINSTFLEDSSQAENDVASNKSPRVSARWQDVETLHQILSQISRWDHASMMDRFSQKENPAMNFKMSHFFV